MNSRVFFSVIVVLCALNRGEAQMMMGRMLGGRFTYVSAGSQTIGISKLNARLNAFGYPSFDETYITLGGGVQFVPGKLMIGAEGAGLLRPTENVLGNFRTSLSGFYGTLTLGYNLFSHDNLLIYPQVGLGGGGMVLKIMERSSPTFDEALLNPRRGVELSSMGFLIDVGIGARYLFRYREGARRGITLGLRAGYVSSFSDRRWRLDRMEIPGGPAASFTGYYVRLMIGGIPGAREDGDKD
jgi:hypothetical protein